MPWPPWEDPLKLEPVFAPVVQEMSAVPPRRGLTPCGASGMVFVVPAVRTAPLVEFETKGAICAVVPCCNRSTTEVPPVTLPGATYDRGRVGWTLTFGVGPVLTEPGATSHVCLFLGMKHVRVSGLLGFEFGLTS